MTTKESNKLAQFDLVYCCPKPRSRQGICSDTMGAPMGSSKWPYYLLYTLKIVPKTSNKVARNNVSKGTASFEPLVTTPWP
ncbi:hypothetical protein TNCV_2807331 [Trichonephila clavipes]|nr:hypothetical protein TNCV_2807331 [Trichonephila clavipes]